MIGGTSMSSLPFLRDYQSNRISSYDQSGGNEDWVAIGENERKIIAEVKGPACIKHIWMTMGIPAEDYCRRIILRIYWEGQEHPSVECPIGDFFGMGHGMRTNFISLPLQMSPQDGKGFNSWWPMPFRKKAVIEVENQGEKPYHHYFYVDYQSFRRESQLEDAAYFHVQWNRERNTHGWYADKGITRGVAKDGPRMLNKDGKDNYVLLEAEGNGIYCGAHLDIDCFQRNPNDWYGEGDDMIFIDGEEWPPSLHGTGTEDWFNCAYSPTQEYHAPYHGIIMYNGSRKWPWKGKQTVYRYHIEDPIRFRKSILATIEHGHANRLSNDYSSTAYYYLANPKRGGDGLPGVDERLPREDEPTYP